MYNKSLIICHVVMDTNNIWLWVWDYDWWLIDWLIDWLIHSFILTPVLGKAVLPHWSENTYIRTTNPIQHTTITGTHTYSNMQTYIIIIQIIYLQTYIYTVGRYNTTTVTYN